MRKSMIEELMLTLKIPQGNFNYSMIEDEISHIPTEQLKEFYKQVMNSESFGNGMKAIISTAHEFKSKRTDNLLAGTNNQAKAMYDKFYGQCCSMLDYTQKDRNKTPDDREFFINMKYESLKNTDGSNTYDKKELYVLNELGGGSWLIDVRFYQNSKEVIDRIEAIIKNAMIAKYDGQKEISNGKVMKMIGEIKK